MWYIWPKKRSAYRILVCTSLGKRPLKRLLDPENDSPMTLQNVEELSTTNMTSYVGRC